LNTGKVRHHASIVANFVLQIGELLLT